MIYINSRFFSQEITGVQRFAIELSQKLYEQRDDVVFLAPVNIKYNEVTKRLNIKTVGKKSGHLWEQYDLPLYLKSIGSPLLINFCNTAPLFYKNKIITLHDVAYKRFPQSYSFKFRQAYNFIIPRLIASSRAVLTVSQFAKSELKHFLHCPRSVVMLFTMRPAAFFTPTSARMTLMQRQNISWQLLRSNIIRILKR